MKTRIIKEAKALLPAFGLTVGLTLAASLLWRGRSAFAGGAILFSIGCTLMGANCFGQEFTSQTMGLLLAQPMSRRRIWFEKMLVLGVAIGLAFGAWLICADWFTDPESFQYTTFWAVWIMAVISAGIFFSAPWLALKTRNTMLASLAIWMYPLGLFLCIVLVGHYLSLDNFFDNFVSPNVGLCLAVGWGIYCAFAYWSGYKALTRFQIAAARQREIALPERWQDALARPLGKLLPRYSSPGRSLLRKEILLQRPAYIAAAALGLMALVAAAVDKIHDTEGMRGLVITPVVVCVIILPLVATGLSVAEERNLGMASWHRTLPPSIRQQWLVKLAVVLGTCVLLGVVLPWFMAMAGQALGLFPDLYNTHDKPMRWVPSSIPRVSCLVYFVALAIGIFASSVSTTTFRAIILTLALGAGTAVLVILSGTIVDWRTHLDFWPNSWFHLLPHYVQILMPSGFADIGLAVGLVVLGLLAYVNYRIPETSPRRAWIHSGIILAVAAVLATTYWMIPFLYMRPFLMHQN